MSITTISRGKTNGVKNRRKGHTFERDIAKYFRNLDFPRACTTRRASRLMDDAKLDISYVPFNIQCKAVEANIDYTILTEEVKNGVNTLVPERNSLPIAIFHKRKSKTHVVFTLEQFTKLINMYGKTNLPTGFY